MFFPYSFFFPLPLSMCGLVDRKVMRAVSAGLEAKDGKPLLLIVSK